MITSGQIRAGRALLRWSAQDLAKQSELGVATVRRAEAADDIPPITEANCNAIRRALEAAGVEFTTGGQPGIRLRKQAETVEALTDEISTLQEALTVVKQEAQPSPAKAMKQMDRARDKNEITKLKNRRAKLKSEGQQ